MVRGTVGLQARERERERQRKRERVCVCARLSEKLTTLDSDDRKAGSVPADRLGKRRRVQGGEEE